MTTTTTTTGANGKWRDVGPGVWVHAYRNKVAGTANSVAFDIGGGRLAVLSPPDDVTPELFSEVESHGRVAALIAPGGHDLGLPKWQARYPDAGTFSPKKTIATLAKKTELRAFRPIGELDAQGVSFLDAKGSRVGSVLARAGGVRYLDELLGNAPLPPSFVFGMVWRITGSGPGLKRNALYTTMMCDDKRALAKECLALIDGATCVVLAHGDVISGDDLAVARRALDNVAS